MHNKLFFVLSKGGGEMLNVNEVFGAVVPLYVAIILGYAAVRWWKIFTPEQCSGINGYVADFAVPFLLLDLVTSNNLYNMNFHVLVADFLQKVFILVILLLWNFLTKKGSFEWVITIFSLSTLSNTLLIGIPILQSMYGDTTNNLLIQIVVLQGIIWYNLLLAMYEYRAAKLLITEQFPSNAGSIASVKVESDVDSFSARESLETDTEIGSNGRLHVVVRNSSRTYPTGASMETLWSLESHPQELKSRSTNSFALQSSERAGARTSRSVSYSPASERNYHRHGSSNGSKVADVPHDVDIIFEPSDRSSLQHETSTKSDTYKDLDKEDVEKKTKPSAGVVTKLIVIIVGKKLIRNPNTYASIVGIIWSLIAFRFNITMPLVIKGSITLMSKTGTGMAMFSLGLFTSLQPKILSCSIGMIVMFTTVRFLVGPIVMAATSAAAGLRGVLLQGSVVQAALPTALVCFVFAKQYNVHPEIFSSSIILTTATTLPVAIAYYYILLRI